MIFFFVLTQDDGAHYYGGERGVGVYVCVKARASRTQMLSFQMIACVWNVSPVMGGGSTTVEGPKNVGMSPEVVTGVLRSPC